MYRVYAIIALLVLGSSIALYVLEFEWFGFTLGVKRLVLLSTLVSTLVGLSVGHWLQTKVRGLTEKVQVYIFFTVVGLVYGPLIGSLSNRLPSHPVKEHPLILAKQRPIYEYKQKLPSPERVVVGHTWFFYYKDRLWKVDGKYYSHPTATRGDTLRAEVRKGLWGFDIVKL